MLNSCRIWSPTGFNTPPHPLPATHCLYKLFFDIGRGGGVVPDIRLKVSPLPPPAVRLCRVSPFRKPAARTCRAYPFQLPAIWTCMVYLFPQPVEWTCRVYPGFMHLFLKCRNAGLSGIWSVRYPNEKKCRLGNQSPTGIEGPSLVTECSDISPVHRIIHMSCFQIFPHW